MLLNRNHSILLAFAISASLCFAQTTETEEKTTAPETSALPTAAELIERFLKETGGRETWEAIEFATLKMKSKNEAMGTESNVSVQWSGDAKSFVVETEIPGMGLLKQGYKDGIGWMINPMMGPSLIEDEAMLEQMRQQGDPRAGLNYEDTYKTMEVKELTKFADEQAYAVFLVDKAGNESTQYFSKESGLMIGMSSMMKMQGGEIEQKTIISDYADHGDVKVSMSSATEVMGMRITTTTEEVSWGEIEASVFDLPEEVQALLPEEGSEEEGSEEEGAEDGEEMGGSNEK